MVGLGKIGRKISKISKAADKEEDMGTGLFGESIIVSAYRDMPLEKLDKLRFILNKIIKKKKEMRRVADAREEQKKD